EHTRGIIALSERLQGGLHGAQGSNRKTPLDSFSAALQACRARQDPEDARSCPPRLVLGQRAGARIRPRYSKVARVRPRRPPGRVVADGRACPFRIARSLIRAALASSVDGIFRSTLFNKS